MTSERWQQVKRLLDQALDRPRAERAAFLKEACAGDAVLRDEVASLLDAYDDEEPFFSEGAFEGALPPGALPPGEMALGEGAAVGPYRLDGVLGRGGMGTVYRAHRDDAQYEREVALKVIRPGLYTEEARRRFRAERQIMATLEYPHIARLYDGGLTEDGRPYFAMERVEGTPLDRYCDDEHVSVQERVQLFAKVARAVAYAHRKLVVHRDLKPSNILITEEGDVGARRAVPKLLDFGVAKLLDPEAAGASDAPATRTGVLPMTPEYAAPEQARGEDITTATDVYALGVLLYELLTGRRPYRFEKRTPSYVEQVICETEPVRPSTAITRAAPVEDGASPRSAEAVGRARRTEAGRLRRTLKGDLDTIILKALRKEPERRYASAEQLAADLERYLDGQPVRARPATLRYRTRTFVRRNGWGVAAAAAMMLLLVGYAATVTVQARRLAEERNRAQVEAAKAEQVSAFLVSLFGASDPFETAGDTVTARELLRRGLERVETLNDQPAVQANMLEAIARASSGLGRYQRADSLLRRALALRRRLYEGDHPDVAMNLNYLGNNKTDNYNFSQALTFYRKALAMNRRLQDADNLRTVDILSGLAEALRNTSRPDSAEKIMREALALRIALQPEDSLGILNAKGGLAYMMRANGKLHEAEALYRSVLARQIEVYGVPHPKVNATRNNLAYLLKEKGDYAEAERYYRMALEKAAALFGPHYAKTRMIRKNNLYAVLRYQHKFSEAASLLRRHLELERAHLPTGHWRVGEAAHALGSLLMDMGRPRDAEPLLREAVQVYTADLGPDHPWTARAKISLGRCLASLKSWPESERLLQAGYERVRAEYPDAVMKDPPGALVEAWLGFGHHRAERGRHAAAESLLVRAHTALRDGPNDLRTRQAARQLVALYDAWGRSQKAAAWRDSLAVLVRKR